jgi:hypothetical protein
MRSSLGISSAGDRRMLQPDFEPTTNFARQARHSTLPFRVRLPAPNQRLTGSIRMKIHILNPQKHQLAPPRKRLEPGLGVERLSYW